MLFLGKLNGFSLSQSQVGELHIGLGNSQKNIDPSGHMRQPHAYLRGSTDVAQFLDDARRNDYPPVKLRKETVAIYLN